MSMIAGQAGSVPTEERIRELYWDDGMTQAEVAGELGRTQARVSELMSEYGIPTRVPSYTAEQVLREIRELAGDLGRPPTSREVDRSASFSQAIVYKYFDGYDEARRAALDDYP